ncbi:MAG: hypothetical protein ACREKH_08130, partial [Candidatus Rokuibacteriota bacterium]
MPCYDVGWEADEADTGHGAEGRSARTASVPLTEIVGRLPGLPGRTISCYDDGRLVQRSYATLYADVGAAERSLRLWGVDRGVRVGIRAANCYEWVVFSLALLNLRCQLVAFPDEFRTEAPEALAARFGL